MSEIHLASNKLDAQVRDMTYTVTVLDRGRPIAKHADLDYETGHELLAAYRAIGWPEEKVRFEADSPEYPEQAAA